MLAMHSYTYIQTQTHTQNCCHTKCSMYIKWSTTCYIYFIFNFNLRKIAIRCLRMCAQCAWHTEVTSGSTFTYTFYLDFSCFFLLHFSLFQMLIFLQIKDIIFHLKMQSLQQTCGQLIFQLLLSPI